MLAAGLWVSDGLFALLAHYGMHTFLMDKQIDYRWGYIAALILVIIGITSIKTKDKFTPQKEFQFVRSGNLFLKGFLVNSLNPFVLLLWIGIAAQVNYATENTTLLFYAGMLSTVMFGDLVKIFFANSISQKMKPKHLSMIRAIGGVILIIAGLVMAYRIIQMQ